MNVKFYIRSSTTTATIYTYILFSNNKYLRTSTLLKCDPNDWLDSKERLKSSINNNKLNNFLDISKKKVTDYLLECRTNQTIPDVLILKKIITQKENKTKKVSDLVEQFIDESKTKARLTASGKALSDGRIKIYKSSLSLLSEFLLKNKIHDDVSVIDSKFLERWQSWMWNNKGFFDNYTGSVSNVYNAFAKWIDLKKITNSKMPVSRKWSEDADVIVLYPQQLKLLSEWKTNDVHLSFYKDIFLFGCMTCLRVSNLLALTSENILEKDNKKFLKFTSVKTYKVITIPLTDAAQNILEKNITEFKEDKIFDITPQAFNRGLKRMAKEFKKHLEENKINSDFLNTMSKTRYKRGVAITEQVNITDVISSHCMRRTGATNLLIAGMSVPELCEFGGWSKSSKEVYRYVKLSKEILGKKVNDTWSNII